MASFHAPRFFVGNRALRELGAGASVSDAGDLANRCSGIQHSRRPSLAWRTAPLPLGEGGPSIEGRRVRVASLFESWDPHPLLRLTLSGSRFAPSPRGRGWSSRNSIHSQFL